MFRARAEDVREALELGSGVAIHPGAVEEAANMLHPEAAAGHGRSGRHTVRAQQRQQFDRADWYSWRGE